MYRKLVTKKLLAIGLSVVVMGYCVEGFGQRPKPTPPPGGKVVVPPPAPRPGAVVVGLPVGYITVLVGGARYFYYGGVFYRKRPHGYVVVRAPVGAVVVALPVGFETYYYYGGVYYQKVPSGYVVVELPPQEAVVQEPPAPIQPPGAEGERVSVTAHTLNVRSGPDESQTVIDQASQGNILVIHGRAPGWFYVQLPSGKFGWVMEKFTAPVSPAPSG